MNDSAPVSSPDRQLVNALSRGLLILACFRVSRPLLTNGQLAEYSNLPRSSVSRLTHTLVKLGYLEYDSRHAAYRLGAKVLSLSYAMLGGMAMRPLILPHMTELAERANSLVALAACEDYSMLIVEAVMGRNTLAQPLEVGSHLALDTTAMGRAYLASCSALEQKKIIQHLTKSKKRDAQELGVATAKAMEEYREQGYCTSIHEWREGVTGVAVPLYLKDFGRTMVLTCGGSAKQLTAKHITETIASLVIKTADEIEQAFKDFGTMNLLGRSRKR
jgi:DNA-binding IclR family transcriptional regulator